MEVLLDPTRFDIEILQRVVLICFANNSNPVERANANHVLTELQSIPFFFQKVPSIVDSGCHEHVKVYAVQALHEAIKSRWNAMDSETQLQIQQYVMGNIEKLTCSKEEMELHHNLLGKFNNALIAIVKHTWPQAWPNFMQVICSAAQTSECMCINSLKILTLLSEEVFEFGEEITSAKSHILKTVFNSEVEQVMNLCQFVIANR
jgi:exportin-1